MAVLQSLRAIGKLVRERRRRLPPLHCRTSPNKLACASQCRHCNARKTSLASRNVRGKTNPRGWRWCLRGSRVTGALRRSHRAFGADMETIAVLTNRAHWWRRRLPLLGQGQNLLRFKRRQAIRKSAALSPGL